MSALPKVPGSQLLAFSNAGFTDTPAYELWSICRDSDDPAFRAWDSFERGIWPSWMDEAERDRQRRILPPSVYERLFENRWTSGGGDYLLREEVEACIDERLDAHTLNFDPARRYYLGIDLGLKHDRSVVAAAHKERETVVLDHLATWYGTPERPVSLEDVFAHLAMLGRRIPRLRRGFLDPWQGAMLLERAKRSGVRTLEEFTFTPANLQTLSQSLWHAFRTRSIRIPPHGELIDELVTARIVERRYGWRVDHQVGGFSDHLIALGLAVVASLPDSGEIVAEDTRLAPLIETYKARVRDWRPFGFGKHSGLRLVNFGAPIGEDLEAAIRLTQLLKRLDRISDQEHESLREHFSREVLRRRNGLSQLACVDDSWLDRELGRLDEFLLKASTPHTAVRGREDASVDRQSA